MIVHRSSVVNIPVLFYCIMQDSREKSVKYDINVLDHLYISNIMEYEDHLSL
jgi:hypothetical protein